MVVALDSSVAIPWLEGRDFPERTIVLDLAQRFEVVMPGVTLAEVLSGRDMPDGLRARIAAFPLVPLLDGYWYRAGELRRKVLEAARRARLGDALIAQACIDADVPLLTRDADFRVFAEVGGLKLYEA